MLVVGNKITDEGAKLLAKALTTNQRCPLKKLALAGTAPFLASYILFFHIMFCYAIHFIKRLISKTPNSEPHTYPN